MADEDEEKLDIVRSVLRDLDPKMQVDCENVELHSQAHRADSFVGHVPLNEEGVRNPNPSINKGCGTRMKSSREISVQAKDERTCCICNKTEGHNA